MDQINDDDDDDELASIPSLDNMTTMHTAATRNLYTPFFASTQATPL